MPSDVGQTSLIDDLVRVYVDRKNDFLKSSGPGKQGLVKEIEVAAAAGYRGIEPWVDGIARYRNEGGSLSDLRRRIVDLGLRVESAIGFRQWIVDDDAKRARELEGMKGDMDLVAQIGGGHIAAPPAGATGEPTLDLNRVAERYGALVELGAGLGVIPQLEIWGPSHNLHRLGEAAYVVVESGQPNACLLPDVYHIYKGGSDFEGLGSFSFSALHMFHMNDYPASPSRAEMNDGHRVMPGDGVAPLNMILQLLASTGGQKVLSVELFNRDYWQQDALEVAKIGLAKMKASVQKALG